MAPPAIPLVLWPAHTCLRNRDDPFSRSRYAGARTRQRLLDLLKVEGPCDARTLASRLKVSTMAVRQHLYALRIQKAVDSRDEMRPMGRPAKIWSLKRAADRYFPDSHAALSLDLLRVARSALGGGSSPRQTYRVGTGKSPSACEKTPRQSVCARPPASPLGGSRQTGLHAGDRGRERWDQCI